MQIFTKDYFYILISALIQDVKLENNYLIKSCLLGLFVLMNSAWQSQAQTWPTKPVRIISGLGAGSSMDLVARTIAPKLAEIWGQSVVIENRTGAAGGMDEGLSNGDGSSTSKGADRSAANKSNK